MPLSKLSHKLFSDALSNFNQARVKVLLDCVQGLVRGNELSLTAIGRHLPGKAKIKHKNLNAQFTFTCSKGNQKAGIKNEGIYYLYMHPQKNDVKAWLGSHG